MKRPEKVTAEVLYTDYEKQVATRADKLRDLQALAQEQGEQPIMAFAYLMLITLKFPNDLGVSRILPRVNSPFEAKKVPIFKKFMELVRWKREEDLPAIHAIHEKFWGPESSKGRLSTLGDLLHYASEKAYKIPVTTEQSRALAIQSFQKVQQLHQQFCKELTVLERNSEEALTELRAIAEINVTGSVWHSLQQIYYKVCQGYILTLKTDHIKSDRQKSLAVLMTQLCQALLRSKGHFLRQDVMTVLKQSAETILREFGVTHSVLSDILLGIVTLHERSVQAHPLQRLALALTEIPTFSLPQPEGELTKQSEVKLVAQFKRAFSKLKSELKADRFTSVYALLIDGLSHSQDNTDRSLCQFLRAAGCYAQQLNANAELGAMAGLVDDYARLCKAYILMQDEMALAALSPTLDDLAQVWSDGSAKGVCARQLARTCKQLRELDPAKYPELSERLKPFPRRMQLWEVETGLSTQALLMGDNTPSTRVKKLMLPEAPAPFYRLLLKSIVAALKEFAKRNLAEQQIWVTDLLKADVELTQILTLSSHETPDPVLQFLTGLCEVQQFAKATQFFRSLPVLHQRRVVLPLLKFLSADYLTPERAEIIVTTLITIYGIWHGQYPLETNVTKVIAESLEGPWMRLLEQHRQDAALTKRLIDCAMDLCEGTTGNLEPLASCWLTFMSPRLAEFDSAPDNKPKRKAFLEGLNDTLTSLPLHRRAAVGRLFTLILVQQSCQKFLAEPQKKKWGFSPDEIELLTSWRTVSDDDCGKLAQHFKKTEIAMREDLASQDKNMRSEILAKVFETLAESGYKKFLYQAYYLCFGLPPKNNDGRPEFKFENIITYLSAHLKPEDKYYEHHHAIARYFYGLLQQGIIRSLPDKMAVLPYLARHEVKGFQSFEKNFCNWLVTLNQLMACLSQYFKLGKVDIERKREIAAFLNSLLQPIYSLENSAARQAAKKAEEDGIRNRIGAGLKRVIAEITQDNSRLRDAYQSFYKEHFELDNEKDTEEAKMVAGHIPVDKQARLALMTHKISKPQIDAYVLECGISHTTFIEFAEAVLLHDLPNRQAKEKEREQRKLRAGSGASAVSVASSPVLSASYLSEKPKSESLPSGSAIGEIPPGNLVLQSHSSDTLFSTGPICVLKPVQDNSANSPKAPGLGCTPNSENSE
jgi:hypothetical protein